MTKQEAQKILNNPVTHKVIEMKKEKYCPAEMCDAEYCNDFDCKKEHWHHRNCRCSDCFSYENYE